MKIGQKRMKCLALSLMALLAVASAQAQTAGPELFRGKTLKILIPTGAGGDRALYTLPFASMYGRNLPGHPTVTPVFMPGAGGSVALNNTYAVAAGDGLTLVTPLASVLNAQLIGEKSVQYDARQFKWIGRTDDATRVLVVSARSKARTLDDLRQKEIIVGAVGQASDTATNALFMNHVFGSKFKVIAGYGASSKIMLAMSNGETEGAFTTWNNIRANQSSQLKNGELIPILQIGFVRHLELTDTPLVLELAATEQDRQLVRIMSSSTLMGQSFAAPPSTAPGILEALRRGFDATMKDPEFIEKMAMIGVNFTPMPGEELERLVTQIMDTPRDIVERYRQIGQD